MEERSSAEITQKLRPPLERYGHHVEKNGHQYVAGVENVKVDLWRRLEGDFFIDHLWNKKVSVWRPKLWNPLNIDLEDRKTRTNMLYLRSITISRPFEEFVDGIERSLYQTSETMTSEDIEKFFKEVYDSYREYEYWGYNWE